MPPKLLWLVVLSMLSAASNAQIYKWVDDDGTVRFSDKPPAGVVPTESAKLANNKDLAPRSSQLQTTPVRVAVDNVEGVENYVLYLDDSTWGDLTLGDYNLLAVQDSAWLRLNDGYVVEFDLGEISARTHKIKSGTKKLKVDQARVIENDLFFFNFADSALDVYDTDSGNYQQYKLRGERAYELNSYGELDKDVYSKGAENVIHRHRFEKMGSNWDVSHVDEELTQGPIALGPYAIANVGEHFLYNYSAYRPRSGEKRCLFELYDASHFLHRSIGNEDIGVGEDLSCRIAASDEREAWLILRNSYSNQVSNIAVFNVEDRSWHLIEANQENAPSGTQEIILTDDYAYYSQCEKLIRMDRRTHAVRALDMKRHRKERLGHCVYDMVLRDDHLYFSPFRRREGPTEPIYLYKLPINLFDTVASDVGS